jgi:hypothetical protein
MNTKRTILSASALLAILSATAITAQAANGTISASGTFTFANDPVSGFDYTVTVLNSASSTASIGSFWFGWTFSGDFLPSDPTAEAGPTGWTATVAPENSKFSIQYVLSTGTAIAPGGSGIFTFTSADSPTVLTGTDSSPSGPTASSFVFNAGLFSSPSEQITITEAPEPSSLGLIALGGLGFAGLGWRKKFFRNA